MDEGGVDEGSRTVFDRLAEAEAAREECLAEIGEALVVAGIGHLSPEAVALLSLIGEEPVPMPDMAVFADFGVSPRHAAQSLAEHGYLETLPGTLAHRPSIRRTPKGDALLAHLAAIAERAVPVEDIPGNRP